MVRIERGNAGYGELYPHLEYIALHSDARESISITGWVLKNAGDKKMYSAGDRFVAGIATYVAIPYGTNLLYGDRPSTMLPIVLNPHDRAIIVSGQPVISSPISIDASFRVNKCSGYIEDLRDYDFTPYLYSQCPRAETVVGPSAVDSECYNFVKRLGQCQNLVIERNRDGDQTINGRILPGLCKKSIETKLNYGACVAEFQNDADFYGNEWRIFLHRSSLLWASERETITLFDDRGKIVDELSY